MIKSGPVKDGHSYPNTIKINIPAEDYHVTLVCLSSGSNGEFVHEELKALSGCQCLYKIIGTYQYEIIDIVVAKLYQCFKFNIIINFS